MNKQIRWLLTEMDRWVADGVISAEQAGRLRSRYPNFAEGTPWGLLVFASAGATIIGLGVILLFAYNWDDIPKFGKLALIFLAVLGAHGGGIFLYRQGGWQRKLGDAFMLLGSMFYGAAIWLIAQIYHIDEHYPNGFLIWALGALALAWAIESIPQALLAAILFTIWGSCETLQFDQAAYWAIVAVLVGIGPLAWRKRSGLLTSVVLSGVYFLLITTLVDSASGAHAVTAILAVSVLLIAGEKLIANLTHQPVAGRGAWLIFGFGGFLVISYLLGFHRMADDLLDWNHGPGVDKTAASVCTWILFASALGTWAGAVWKAVKKEIIVPVEEWLCPIALIYAYLLASQHGTVDDLFIAVTFNLITLGIAIMWMLRGCREAQIRPTVLGSILLAGLVFARYFDLFDSLASRGITFLLLGAVLLGEALYYRKNHRPESFTRGGGS